VFLLCDLFFLFLHGLDAPGANRQPLAVDFLNLEIKILPFKVLDIGMGPGGVLG
jgi:hypothetical protein